MTAEAGLVDRHPRMLGPFTIGPLGFGLWRFTTPDVDHAQALVEGALAAGLNLVDTADVYGLDWGGTGFGSVEELLGKVLAQAPQLRDRMVLATKGGIHPPIPYDSGPGALRGAVEDSLRRLGVDRIDLYQIHRPDLFTHPAVLAETLMTLRDEGKLATYGVSNFTPSQTRALVAHLDEPLVSTQPEYSAVHLDPLRDGTFDLCMETGLVPLAWSPLAGGSLATGAGVSPALLATLDRLAERESCARTDIAVAFVLAHPARPVALLGTQNPDRLAAAPAALGVHLDRNDVYDIIEAAEGVALP